MSNFKVGDKVRCVRPKGALSKGEIYVVTDIYNVGDQPLVRLDTAGGGYFANRFRRVLTEKQRKASIIIGSKEA